LRYQKFREIEISRKKTFNEAATLIYKNIVSSPLVLLLIIIIILLLKKNSSTIMEKNNNTTLYYPPPQQRVRKLKKVHAKNSLN